MIQVQDLKKSYGEKPALKGISFRVETGEIFGFLGPNGAGKTTTIKILTGQLLPSDGKASIQDYDCMTDQDKIRQQMGVVPESTNLYERLTVEQNLVLFCRLYDSDMENIHYFLKAVGMEKEMNTPVKKLSKGMKQRVLLARALLHRPKVLFLDEPTSGLDPASADVIHKLLIKLNQEGMTIFLTTHNMEEADRLCHRVAFLDSGSISIIGRPNDLKLEHTTNRIRVLVQDEEGMKEHILNTPSEESGLLICQWMQEGKLKSIHSLEPTLADIFMKVTGRELT